ncbi:MAG: ATP-dependent helicase [Ferroplasma sp.]
MKEEKLFNVNEALPFMDDIVAEWFNSKYSDLSEPQKKAIPFIHNKQNVLVSSPTGTGKTLTGFLSIINELFIKARNNELEDKIYCVYISPLKALANDINKNLNAPLNEIYELAEKYGIKPQEIRVAVRSGDTPQKDRSRMLKNPPHILITTPESLSLAITAIKFREKFSAVEYVIVDEIHEVSSTKRGSMLSLNLERLEALSPGFTRIGLSATQAPLDLIGNYLCGYSGKEPRPCEIIEVNTNKYLDLSIITPVKDLTLVSYEVANEKMYDILVDMINSHKTTLIFTNTRSATEHVAMRLKARGIENIEAHHSSLGKQTRVEVENRLKEGELKCVISSTSLELGIDIGFIDLVVQIGSPKSVSRALQRIGRAGHGVRDLSIGRFIVFDLDDLMECAVMTRAAYEHEIDRVTVPVNPLDVLSQGIIGMSLEKAWDVDEAYTLLKHSYAFHTLDREDYISTLEYLSGKIEGSTLFSKIWYDKSENKFGKKGGTRMIYFMNVGTIPDEANYNVINEKGRMLGQLSDKFVERLKNGDIFVLGAKTYMMVKSSKNNIMVRAATGMKPTVPSWTGELLPRSYDLGILIGQFRKELYRRIKEGENTESWLIDNYHVDPFGARSLISYVKSQGDYDIPTENHLYVEGYLDESFYSIIFHIPLGRRVNDSLSRAYALAISNKYSVSTRISVNDNGFMITVDKKIPIENTIHLLNTKNFADMVNRSILNTELFKQRFRYCATRSLMVLRKYKQADISVTRQQLRSDRLLRVLESIKNFPIIKEAFNEVKNDVMDVERAQLYIDNVISENKYKISEYSAETSPFSYNLILSGVSDIVLMEDRSKLLRELRSHLMDKIYGTEDIEFLIKDSKTAENYFRNKIPAVSDKDSYMDFIKHFLYIDPFKPKFNSPLNYSSMDLTQTTDELVKNGDLIYAFLRSDQWAYKEYYPIFYSLFKKNIEPVPGDAKLYELINGSTFNQLKNAGMDEHFLADSLLRLLSSYKIRKSIKNGSIIYIKNDWAAVQDGNMDCHLRTAIRLILGSYGPLSIDELLIKLPVDSNMLEASLNSMVDSEEVIYDYITPVFMKQYMLKSDFENIVKTIEIDIQARRILNFSQPVASIEEYFEKYGFAFDVHDIIVRMNKFNFDSLKELVNNNAVYYQKIIKNKYAYIAKWLMDLLYYLRDEPSSEEENKILEFIKRGIDTEDKLSDISGYEKTIIRAIIHSLKFKVKIIEAGDSLLEYIPGTEPNTNEIIDKYGPVTSRELTRFFWFNPNKLDYSRFTPFYYKNEVYYGNIRAFGLAASLIVKKDDPISIYLGKYFKNESYNARFIHNGIEASMFYIAMKEPGMWIENIEIEEKDADGFFKALQDTSGKLALDSIIIHSSEPSLINAGHNYKFEYSDGILYHGNFEVQNITMGELLSAALRQYSPKNLTFNYKSLSEILLGIRTDIEGYYSGVRSIELSNYFNSGLVYQFNGPYGITAYGTKNVIALYNSIRKRNLTDAEGQIYKYLMSENMTEMELARYVKLSSQQAKNAIKELFRINAVARNKDRKYVPIIENIPRLDAIEKLMQEVLERIGFFDKDMFMSMLGLDSDKEYHMAIKKLVKEKKIIEILIPGEDFIIYMQPGRQLETKPKSFIRIIPPRDIIAMLFSDYIRSSFKTVNTYLIFIDNSIKLSIHVKKDGKYLGIKKIDGDRAYLDAAKKEFNNIGFILSGFESP